MARSFWNSLASLLGIIGKELSGNFLKEPNVVAQSHFKIWSCKIRLVCWLTERREIVWSFCTPGSGGSSGVPPPSPSFLDRTEAKVWISSSGPGTTRVVCVNGKHPFNFWPITKREKSEEQNQLNQERYFILGVTFFFRSVKFIIKNCQTQT